MGYVHATSAPQEASAACFALAGVGIPFIILRAATEIALAKEAAEARVQENIRAAMAANPPAVGEMAAR
jgi:hypothetical protein